MNRLRNEEGSALVATIIVMVVVATIGIAATQVAVHTNDATTIDRLRAQSLQAAEAGVHASIDRLELNSACDSAAGGAVELKDGSSVLSKYQARIDKETGMALCADSLNRVIQSWGFAPVSSERTMRHLEVGVQLIPLDGFQFTLFAAGPNGVVVAQNTPQIEGDVYAENLDQTQNNVDARNVVTPGSIDTKDNSVYTGYLWAGGNVKVGQNGQIGHSVTASGTSAAGNVDLRNGVRVGSDVKAKGTVTLGTTTIVNGVVSQGNTSLPAPPDLVLPAFTWDPANYSPAPLSYANAATASTDIAAASGNLNGTWYVNDPSGTVNLTKGSLGSSPFRVSGPLTIVTTGKVKLGRDFTNVGGPWPVVIVSLNSGSNAIEIDKPMIVSPSLDLLLYTLGEVAVKNNSSFTGAIYADQITIKNSFTVNRSEYLASNPPAGFDFTQASAARFAVVPLLWREIVPGLPPA